MKPINYKRVENGFIFEYKNEDLEAFHKYGKENGDNGWYIISEINGRRLYEGYGTIDNPHTECYQLNLQIHKDWDGIIDPDVMCGFKQSPPIQSCESYRLVLLDFNK